MGSLHFACASATVFTIHAKPNAALFEIIIVDFSLIFTDVSYINAIYGEIKQVLSPFPFPSLTFLIYWTRVFLLPLQNSKVTAAKMITSTELLPKGTDGYSQTLQLSEKTLRCK